MNVADVRKQFLVKWANHDFVHSCNNTTVEIVGASFLADEPTIFGAINRDYLEQELAWYKSQSLNIRTMSGKVPDIWLSCANERGDVNSNYGWCLDSDENGNQRRHVIQELRRDRCSRRATAIYTRPSMHTDATKDGKQDFVCTNAVEYFIRKNKLDCVVQMRSSDAVLGYRNDYAWHAIVLSELATVLEVQPGKIIWQAGSLHVYERHFFYIERLR